MARLAAAFELSLDRPRRVLAVGGDRRARPGGVVFQRGRVRRARARAAGPAGARGRERAPGGDRRLRRARRDGHRARPDRPRGDRLDDPLPGEGAGRPRLPRGRAHLLGAENPPELCPVVSLADLFRTGAPQSRAERRALLDAVPRYFSQGAISADRKVANLRFGIRLMPLDRQQEVIDDIKRRSTTPLERPAGVNAQVAGLPGAGRRGQREAGVALVAAGHAARVAAAGVRRAVAALGARRARRRRPADPGGARRRLVGRDPVRCCRSRSTRCR